MLLGARVPGRPRPRRNTATSVSARKRLRRQRVEARTVLRLVKAREALLSHHSATSMAPRGGGNSKGDKGERGGGARPRTPYWSCGKCGEAENSCWREECRGCKTAAPAKFRRIAEEARKKAEAAQSGKPSFSKGPSKQGSTQAGSNALKELRAPIAELKRKVGTPAAVAASVPNDDEADEEADGPTIAQLVATRDACATVFRRRRRAG